MQLDILIVVYVTLTLIQGHGGVGGEGGGGSKKVKFTVQIMSKVFNQIERTLLCC